MWPAGAFSSLSRLALTRVHRPFSSLKPVHTVKSLRKDAGTAIYRRFTYNHSMTGRSKLYVRKTREDASSMLLVEGALAERVRSTFASGPLRVLPISKNGRSALETTLCSIGTIRRSCFVGIERSVLQNEPAGDPSSPDFNPGGEPSNSFVDNVMGRFLSLVPTLSAQSSAQIPRSVMLGSYKGFAESGIPLNIDPSSGNPIGVGMLPATAEDASYRATASTCISRPKPPANLSSWTGLEVTRILFRATTAIGVEVNGGEQVFRASQSIIHFTVLVSTPKLLLLSGLAQQSVERVAHTRRRFAGCGRQPRDHIFLRI